MEGSALEYDYHGRFRINPPATLHPSPAQRRSPRASAHANSHFPANPQPRAPRKQPSVYHAMPFSEQEKLRRAREAERSEQRRLRVTLQKQEAVQRMYQTLALTQQQQQQQQQQEQQFQQYQYHHQQQQELEQYSSFTQSSSQWFTHNQHQRSQQQTPPSRSLSPPAGNITNIHCLPATPSPEVDPNFLVVQGTATSLGRHVHFVVREYYATCLSATLTAASTGQSWVLFVPCSEAVMLLLRVWHGAGERGSEDIARYSKSRLV